MKRSHLRSDGGGAIMLVLAIVAALGLLSAFWLAGTISLFGDRLQKELVRQDVDLTLQRTAAGIGLGIGVQCAAVDI